MLLGKTLRQAREEKGLTISQVAEATRMMTQIIEDLEREDFRRIAAPIYGRGFIKLYAEYLGLDPEPLIQEFIEIYTGSRPPQIVRRTEAPPEPRTVEQTDGLTGGKLDSPAVPPADRPTVLPSDSPTGEPDLFSLAAVRSEAVRSVADPAQPGETAPPRVRPAVTRATVKLPAVRDPVLRRAPVKAQENHGAAEASSSTSREDEIGKWLTAQGKPVLIGVAAVIVLLLAASLIARKHKTSKFTGVKSAPVTVERVLPPAAPYFD